MAKPRKPASSYETLPGQQELPFADSGPVINPFDALLSDQHPPPVLVEKPDETLAQEADSAPLVKLPADAYADLVAPTGTFSDDPPPGWVDEPASSQDLDPVAAARASLLEDAARALGGDAAPPAPATAVPVTRRGSRAPDIRQALARAAASSEATRYRSRVTIGAAWQYDGRLHSAPLWIDRNWLAYDEGPALSIPDVGLVRKDQWLVMQDVLNDDESVAFSELKIYDDGVFRSLFMPVGHPSASERSVAPDA